jgi:hypothetical protein
VLNCRRNRGNSLLVLDLTTFSKEFPRVAIRLTEVISIRTSYMTRPTP